MKKIIAICIALMAAGATASAQMHFEDRTIDDTTIRYITEEFRCEELSELIIFLPTVLTLTDGEEGIITISYPMDESPYIRYGIVECNKLTVGRNGDVKTPKNTILSNRVPIYLTISASQLSRIANFSDMELYIERDMFAESLNLQNGLTLGIVAESITATDKIKIFNNGTMTCNVKEWNTAILDTYNNGYLHIAGITTAKQVAQMSGAESINDIDLWVDCDALSIFSRGKGRYRYRGTADDVNITNRGKRCRILTSELNR